METATLIVRVVLALACVLGLIWFAGKKLAGTPAGRRQRTMPLTVIGRQSLGKGAGIALVEVAGRVLLLGIGEQGVRVLTEIDAPSEGTELALVGAPEHPAILATQVPGLVPMLAPDIDPFAQLDDSAYEGGPAEFREELDLSLLGAPELLAPDGLPFPHLVGSDRLASLAGLAGLAASSSARHAEPLHASALHGSVLSPATWRRAVDVVQQRTVRR